MATRTPRARKKDAPAALDNSLLLALQYINAAQREPGTKQQTHCIIRDGWAVACNGVLTMGHPVHDDLGACPQTARLIAALQRCKEAFSISQAQADRISVKAGGFRVSVPCVDLIDLPVTWADPNIAVIDERFTDACKAIGHLATEGAQTTTLASMLLCGQMLLATNGVAIAQAWHGIDLPPYIVIPKASIAALLKIDKKLIGFGCSQSSITFHFEDTSWLKTQCYQDKWANWEKVFDPFPKGVVPDVPAGLFEALNDLAPFANADQVAFKDHLLVAVTNDKDSAEHDVPNLIGGSIFGVKQLQLIASIAKQLDTTSSDKAAYFLGSQIRGVLMKCRE